MERKVKLTNPSLSRWSTQRFRGNTDGHGSPLKSLFYNIDKAVWLETQQSSLFCLLFIWMSIGWAGGLKLVLHFAWADYSIQPPSFLAVQLNWACTLHSLLKGNTCAAFAILAEYKQTGLTAVSENDWTQISYPGLSLQLVLQEHLHTA